MSERVSKYYYYRMHYRTDYGCLSARPPVQPTGTHDDRIELVVDDRILAAGDGVRLHLRIVLTGRVVEGTRRRDGGRRRIGCQLERIPTKLGVSE